MHTVAKMVLLGDCDVIIGMDILGMGDFAVTHQNGNTTFSFCLPSRREIDYATEINNLSKMAPVISSYIAGRNDPCPCKSGKKYKKCHGR